MLTILTICLYSFFGHFSHRSEWQLIKIDYKSIYSRKCTEEDYQTWHLHNQVRKITRACIFFFYLFFFFTVQAIQMNITNSVLILPTGWAMRDGTKTNLHEAQAWKLLHAGKGLLQNPLSGVLYLPSSWFWMVRWCVPLYNSSSLENRIVERDHVSLIVCWRRASLQFVLYLMPHM